MVNWFECFDSFRVKGINNENVKLLGKFVNLRIEFHNCKLCCFMMSNDEFEALKLKQNYFVKKILTVLRLGMKL